MLNKYFSAKKTCLDLLFILVLLGCAWQSGCQMQTSESSMNKKEPGKIAQIKKAGKIIIGTSADYPPYEFRLLPEIEDDFVGIDMDIAEAIAADLNVKLEIKNIVFNNLFKELDEENIDLILAGLAPSESRQKIVDFSIPYYQAIQNMLIRTKDKEKIKLLEDLRGKKVGTQAGSIQEDMAKSMIFGATFITRPTIQTLIDELATQKLDAVILEKPVADTFVFKNKDFLNLECNSNRTPLGSAAAVKKGNKELLDRINQILEKLIKENKINQFVQDAKVFTDKI
ncbi:MAG: transporter substrate-binding domain-containing protein [Candidatus Aminicenantes bacterium]|nr:transporter substrate-binding domain-containing protein [Candidatus Aminicenantes bacterium]